MTNDEPEVLTGLPVHEAPAPPPSGHRLRVDGLVTRPTVLDPAGLGALPRAEVTDDFICREGWCVPGLHWEGVSLATVLEVTGADPNAPFVQVSAGGFSTALTRADAERALLATDLGDQPLPHEHGGPVRLVVPGADCYTSVKWVDHIEVRQAPGEDTARVIALARVARRSSS